MSSHLRFKTQLGGSEVLPPGDPALPEILDPSDERPMVRAALERWLMFQQRVGLDPYAARRLLCEAGGVEGALRRAPEGRRDPPGFDDALRRLLECGATALPILSPAYPDRLKRLPDAPPLLLVRGDVGALATSSIAIVGSRAATVYGIAAAREFAGELARAGLTIVSGLAYGVDAAAHRAALEAGGQTVAVQGCGIDRVYPAMHSVLASEIVSSGAVVSEFALGTPPQKGFFPLRNRAISGLARAVIVVEARERSGSLITARLAADQGVDVFAVPGPITAPTSVGTNRLLRDGAWVAALPSDVLEVLEIDAASPVERVAQQRADAESTRIIEALQARPESRDELARRLGCTPARLALTLLELELEGHVAEDRDGRLRTVEQIAARVRLSPSDPEGIILVMDGERVAAYDWTLRSLGAAGSIGWISMTGVHPDYRGKGLGTLVVTAGLDHLKSKGVEAVELEVDSDNVPARELYLKLGFKKLRETIWRERRFD